ncbi:TY-Chap domain-containing protein [Actinomarinicola tropica]|uniref:TY-Chap N-terminal domain-containing protein n=1 Tax=Actinomarinicola tropica TaxID=2789776 RepID=A0A5Q2RME3_9ACTN|nr:hypothetical protein [Actinomarinicola tropica]QGG94355.1 hypothetical protein GH723_04135 [Actinomarinicola tropica]
MTSLEHLVEPLSGALAALTEDESLIISRPGSLDPTLTDGSNRFVQFTRFGSDLRAESVGDRYLEGADQLTPDQVTVLLELGWETPDEGGNYWGQWEEPVPLGMVAAMAVRTLQLVHGVEHIEQLDIDGSPEITRTFRDAPGAM